MTKSVSVIVRSKNEEATIGRTLRLIREQSVKPKEIILIDNDSVDDTKKIACGYGCDIINILDCEFNHAYSCNLGAMRSTGELLVFTNAHSFPHSPYWLESGMRHFHDSKVAGVYGMPAIDLRASLPERLVEKAKQLAFGQATGRIIDRMSIFTGLGLMNTGSAMLRRDLWLHHPFDAELSAHGGGEDSEWGFYHLKKGYRIVEDSQFTVYHCHGDSLPRYLVRSFYYYLTYFLAYRRNVSR